MGSAVNIALPSIAAEFDLDAVSLSLVASSYLLATAIFLVPLGRCADIYGRKKVFTLGVTIFTASALLSALATSGPMLIVFRFLEGIGSAMIYGTGVAMITSVFPPEERGRVLGINVTAVYVGLSIGPLLGGYLTELLTWRSIFLTNIPLGIYIVYQIRRHLAGEWADACGERLDIVGSVFYGAMLLFAIYGFSLLPEQAGVAAIVAGVAFSVVFYAWERRVESPVLNIGLLASNRAFAFSNLTALINYGATFAVGFLLSLYLQYIRGYEPVAAGTLLLVQPVIQVFVAPVAGRLADRVQPGHVASVGMAISAVGLFGLSMLGETTSVGVILALLILLGVGVGLFSSPNTTAIMGCVEKRFYGSASAMTAMMRSLGMMLSMGAVLVVFAVIMGSTAVTPAIFPEFLTSVHLIFLAFGILSTFGVFLSLRRNKC